jgi:hypothetical protein
MQESDLALVSSPNNAALPYMIHQHKMVNEADKELLDGLARAGFKVDGEGTGGLFAKYRMRGGVRPPALIFHSFAIDPIIDQFHQGLLH